MRNYQLFQKDPVLWGRFEKLRVIKYKNKLLITFQSFTNSGDYLKRFVNLALSNGHGIKHSENNISKSKLFVQFRMFTEIMRLTFIWQDTIITRRRKSSRGLDYSFVTMSSYTYLAESLLKFQRGVLKT